MKKVVLLLVCVLFACVSSAVAADGLAKRVTDLEARLSQGWFEKIQLSGAIEVEANYTDEDGDKSSDVDLATFDLGVDVAINEMFSGYGILSWDGDEEKVIVDEGGITLGNVDEMGYAVTAGKLYVPFGVFETAMLADPLTLELGETLEGAVVVDFASGGFYGAAYAFNSAQYVDGDDDMIDSFGAMAGYVLEADSYSLDVSAGFISDISSSGGFDGAGGDDTSAGMTVSAVAGVGDFTLVGEYLAALDSDYADGATDEPSAWYVELSYGFDMSGHGASIAATYQESDEADFLGLAETRYGAAFGYEITEGLGLTVEYLRDEGYDDTDVDSMTAQLALEF